MAMVFVLVAGQRDVCRVGLCARGREGVHEAVAPRGPYIPLGLPAPYYVLRVFHL